MLPLLALLPTALAGPVAAFDLTLDLPASASAQQGTASVRMWVDQGAQTVWTVEQRGDGKGGIAGALPDFARLVANGSGATSVDDPTMGTIAGLEAAEVHFRFSTGEAEAWVFRSAGYLYAVTVTVAQGASLAEPSEHLRSTLKAPPDVGPPPAAGRLADLGWELPGAAGLPVSAVATSHPTVSVTDPAARTALIVIRLSATEAPFTKQGAAGVTAFLTGGGCQDVVTTTAELAGLPAFRSTCWRTSPRGEVDVDRWYTVPAGSDVYLFRAATSREREAGLDAWMEQRLAGARRVSSGAAPD